MGETLAGRERNIKAYSIAVEALGKPPDFDPQNNPYVRVHANRLRQALEDYYSGEGAGDEVRIELPKGRYVPVFVPNLRTGSEGSDRTRPQPPPGVSRLVVMPFGCSGEDSVPGSMPGDVAESLASALDLFENIEVVSLGMVEAFCGNSGDMSGAGRKFGAQYALAGRITRKDGALLVPVSLACCDTGRHIWSKEFREEASSEEAARLVERVSSQTAAHLGGICGVLAGERPPPDAARDGEAVYRAKHAYAEVYKLLPTAALFEDLVGKLKTALKSSPRDGTLHSMLAEVDLAKLFFGFSTDPALVDAARDHVSGALLADPNNQFARFMEGFLYFYLGYGDMALDSFKAAIGLNPNDVFMTGVCGYGIALLGHFEQGLAIMEQGRDLNPYYLKYNFLPHYLERVRHGEYDKALEAAEQFFVPGIYLSPLLRCVALALLGRSEEARLEYGKILEMLPDFTERAESYIEAVVYPEDLREKFRTALTEAAPAGR